MWTTAVNTVRYVVGRLTEHPAENELYPHVNKKTYVDSRSLTTEYLSLATFLIIAICVVINLLTWDGTPWFWRLRRPYFYAWVLIRVTIISMCRQG